MLGPVDARRRWFGTLFLIVAIGMLFWGQSVLKSRLEGMGFVLYWLVCFLFTGLAFLTAILDFRAVRQQSRDEHRDLFRHSFDGLEADRDTKANQGKR